MKGLSMENIDQLKWEIKERLYQREFVKEAERSIIDHLVSPTQREDYIIYKDPVRFEPNIFRQVVRMFTSMLIGNMIDKVIDAVIEEHEIIKNERNGG
jgi:hypothetical protein